MNHPGRKRLYFGAGIGTAVAAVAVLALGATFGLFSSQTNVGSSTFTAGTVTLSQGAAFTCTLTPSDVKPGDSGTCTFNYNYAGNPAWLAVDIAGTSTAASSVPTPYGGTSAPTPVGLLDGTTPLSLSVNTGPALTLSSHSVNNVLLSSVSTPTTTGGSITLNWSLPVGAANDYQGASATLSLLVHAVQAKNNPMAGGVSGSTGTLAGCTQYAACPAASVLTQPFAWS